VFRHIFNMETSTIRLIPVNPLYSESHFLNFSYIVIRYKTLENLLKFTLSNFPSYLQDLSVYYKDRSYNIIVA